MKESQLSNSTAELIRRLPTLPKERLLVLWRENFGKPVGSVRAELMLPVLAFRIQEKAYGGLDAGVTGRLREITAFTAKRGVGSNPAPAWFGNGRAQSTRSSSPTMDMSIRARSIRVFPPLPARSQAPTGQVPHSSEPRRKGSKSDLRTIPDSLRHLHPEIIRRRTRSIFQFPARPEGGL